ncbi:hypothetical protein SCLCIDRAFT_1209179 [Scleroderma citrinum Foug A]|uniref:Uncharacterized protein n=1 Tax=Scleroderma citrinum Foug A TaxID=1036808 RepID=A0A0C3A5J0_9AGAM|nr:hypothetical protein SCLCIDRAFT_1209179 [Scleroderma citrinum Foug A]
MATAKLASVAPDPLITSFVNLHADLTDDTSLLAGTIGSNYCALLRLHVVPSTRSRKKLRRYSELPTIESGHGDT